jgi:filamentous hemagglutinin family protein
MALRIDWNKSLGTASHGEDALMQYKAHSGEFEAIVTDHDMPQMNGSEFIRSIREMGFKGRIVLMSGNLSLNVSTSPMRLVVPILPGRFLFHAAIAIGIVLLSSSLALCAPGVVLDGSFGTSGALPGPNFIITASMGRQIGPNLFQSFSDFNLTSSQSATFTGTGSTGPISNILARVTGGSASTIDGTINSQIAGANLFLLNPSGVVFGPNAQVNVTGSFVVGTPNYLKLADGGKFNTSLGNDSQLSSAPVSAFGFLSATPKPVSFAGTQFSNPGGIHIIGGDLTFDQGTPDGGTLRGTSLLAASGNLTLFSAASVGEVPFNLAMPGSGYGSATNTSFGNITIQNQSKLAIDGTGGGSVVIRGGHLVVDNSTISSVNSGSIAGGTISVQSDQVALQNAGVIYSRTSFSGSGSNILVDAGSLTITGSGIPNSVAGIESLTSSSGNSGNVTLNVAGVMTISNVGTVASLTFGNGSAGNITIHAGSLNVVSESEVFSISESLGTLPVSGQAGSINVTVANGLLLDDASGLISTTASQGGAGSVTVLAGSVAIANGGLISSNTSASGNGSNVEVIAGSLNIDSAGGGPTGIASTSDVGATGAGGSLTVDVSGNAAITGTGGGISSSTYSSGNGGQLTVNVGGLLSLTNGAEIVGGTFSSGQSGSMLLQAGSFAIDSDGNIDSYTGVLDQSNNGATGNAGPLTVNVAGDLTITEGAEISSTAFSSGEGGALTVNVGGALAITYGGLVTSGTFSSGTSGALLVQADSIYLDSLGFTEALTGIANESSAGATGNSGSLTVDVANSLVISDGGEISSGTKSTGNGGEVVVQAGSLTIENAQEAVELTGISSETDGTFDIHGNPTGQGGNAGSVTVTVNGVLNMTGGEIDTNTFCLGNAGNVTVQAGSLSINGAANPLSLTGIFSDSNRFAGNLGQGGNAGSVNVSVNGELSLLTGGAIGALTLTSGQGNVNIQANSVEIDGALTGITAQAVGTGNGGSITLSADTVTLSNSGLITASSVLSNAGTITINASTEVSLTNSGTITTQAGLNGGNITLNVEGLVYLLDSKIIAAAENNGGNIFINSQFAVLDDSVISANAALGQGGNITIITSNFLNNNSAITATGTTDGTIDISAPDLDLSGSLIALPATLVNEEKRLREKCARAVNHEFSTLIVVGRGGTESAPEELQPDFGLSALSSEPLPQK